jgi:hypothetical protein
MKVNYFSVLLFALAFFTLSCEKDDDAIPETSMPNSSGVFNTVNATEHADIGRSHVFKDATFGGSLDPNTENEAIVRSAPGFYPGTYNVVTRNENEVFVYYGVYGDVPGSTGPAVARLDVNTLEEVWNIQLAVYENETAWNYPGVIGMHGNGSLIVVSGNTIASINPDNGDINKQVDLPQLDPTNASYNGFITTSDGTIFTKALFRSCSDPGGLALATCLDETQTQTLLAIDPNSLEIITQVELPDFATGRMPVGTHNGQDYIYLPGVQSLYRYSWDGQSLVFDSGWGFVTITESGDGTALAPNVVGDWVFAQVNTYNSNPASVWAISATNSSKRHTFIPFEDIPTPVSFAVAHGAFDPDNGLLFAADAGARHASALSFDPETGFTFKWRERHTTSVFQQLVGSANNRVLVMSELINFPPLSLPLTATNEEVVFRDATTGRELSRSEPLPRMSDGANISPGYGGRVYYPGVDGKLYEITVQ